MVSFVVVPSSNASNLDWKKDLRILEIEFVVGSLLLTWSIVELVGRPSVAFSSIVVETFVMTRPLFYFFQYHISPLYFILLLHTIHRSRFISTLLPGFNIGLTRILLKIPSCQTVLDGTGLFFAVDLFGREILAVVGRDCLFWHWMMEIVGWLYFIFGIV